MYHLLFVDDEQIAWEGIKQSIDWNSLHIQPSTARNGKDAYDTIIREQPDIVITDIRMPDMNGLELVKKVRAYNQALPFVILSGYDEFNYAREAMIYGVRHYLLKPARPMDIYKVLQEIIAEIEESHERENKQNQAQIILERVKPQLKEQFLSTACLINQDSDDPEQEVIKNMLGISNDLLYSIALFEPDHNPSFRNAFLLKEIIKDLYQNDQTLCNDNTFLITVVENCVLLLIDKVIYDHLVSFINLVQSEFCQCTGATFTSALALSEKFDDIGKIYNQLKDCVQYRFYLGDGGIITPDEILIIREEVDRGSAYEYEQVALAAGIGNLEKTDQLLHDCFESWYNCESSPPVRILKFYCLELISHIINRTGYEPEAEHSYIMLMSDSIDSPEALFRLTRESILSIVSQKYESTKSKTYDIIKKVLDYVQSHYYKEDLSLSWIAKNVVFLNADYIGRLFKKETGQNFNPYLCELRIEHAKTLFQKNPKYSIVDVAQQVGLCKNPQYFAHLFKQRVGITPRMYKLQFQKINEEYTAIAYSSEQALTQ